MIISRRTLIGGAALGAVALTTATTTAKAANPMPVIRSFSGIDPYPAIFVGAHQDDETLTLGPEIEKHKAAGRFIIAVLVTDGRSSGARSATGLSPMDFSAARDREYLAACAALGVDEVHYECAVDGYLSDEQARALAWYWTVRYPQASFKVQSWRDSSPDHAKIGQAFQDRWVATGRTLDLRHYVKRDDWARVASQGVPLRVVQGGAATLRAADEYRYVNQAIGRYGIGQLSVGRSFDELRRDPSTRMHLPTE